MNYDAGDHLSILTCNDESLVKSAFEVLGITGDEVVECNPGLTAYTRGFPSDLPKIPLTARLALSWLPDLAAAPTRKVLNRLAELCPCPPEAAGLRGLADEKNYKTKVIDTNLTLSEILSTYKSVSIDVEEFCSLLPRLKPRFYSISSSPLVDPSRVSITVGLVKYVTKAGRAHQGQASGMVNSLAVGNRVFANIKKLNGKFTLPKDPEAPVIMVGPGTGVAPFVGFLEERNELAKDGNNSLGPAHLFFGCRSSNTDYIYRDTLEAYTNNGVLSPDGLHVAFSREENQPKVYVQNLITKHSDELWKLLESGATVYICGDAKRMSPDVKAAFVDIAVKNGMTQDDAKNWMDTMIGNEKYLEDVYA